MSRGWWTTLAWASYAIGVVNDLADNHAKAAYLMAMGCFFLLNRKPEAPNDHP